MRSPLTVVGVDLSLTCTGLATLTISADGVEWECRRVRSSAVKGVSGAVAVLAQSERMTRIVAAVAGRVPVGALVVVEGLAFGSNTASARDIAGLWWRFVEAVRGLGSPLLIVPPASRAKYATGHGRASKDAVMVAVGLSHPGVELLDHNVADAVALAALGARVLGVPVEVETCATAAQEAVAARVAAAHGFTIREERAVL